jgi:hypothetical protein
MKRQIEFSAWLANATTFLWCLPVAIALVAAAGRSGFAAGEFQELVNQIPRSANAVVLLNMEKAKNSPLGIKEDWKGKIENAFAAGLVRVPPQATRFVLASQIDFEFMEPIWSVAVMDLDEEMALEPLAKARGGTLDTIEGLPALSLPNDTYLVLLGPKRIGAMAPGNRQEVVRWIREIRKPSPPPLSPYLQKAAVYSDEAGSEIIMALDLDGVMSFERVGKYLKAHEKELDEWQSQDASKMPMKLTDMANLLSNIIGVRIGVRIGEQQSSVIAVDLRTDAYSISSFAKPLLLQVLSDKGAMIDDFQSWTAQTKGSEISLAGTLSTSGRQRLLSVVDSPVQENTVANEPYVSPGELPAAQAKKSREYFRTIVEMADDLKDDMKNAKNLASTQLFFDKYAKRIERMPILGVDEALVDYGAFVANTLRQATGSVKTMGIKSGVRQAQITGADVSGGYYGYGYGGYRYGAYGGYGPRGEVRAVGSERRVVRAEEKAVAATDVQQLRQAMIAATTDIRRKMTQKYQIEF